MPGFWSEVILRNESDVFAVIEHIILSGMRKTTNPISFAAAGTSIYTAKLSSPATNIIIVHGITIIFRKTEANPILPKIYIETGYIKI